MSLPSNSGRHSRPPRARTIGECRSPGDAPAIGPVARMQPGSCPHRRRKVSHRGAPLRITRNGKILRWLVLLLGILCIGLVIGLMRPW